MKKRVTVHSKTIECIIIILLRHCFERWQHDSGFFI